MRETAKKAANTGGHIMHSLTCHPWHRGPHTEHLHSPSDKGGYLHVHGGDEDGYDLVRQARQLLSREK